MNNAAPAILNPDDLRSPLSIPFTKTALLLLDFHKFIFNSQPQGPSILRTASSLRTWAKAQGILIVHCLIDLKAHTSPHQKMAVRANAVRQKMALPLEVVNSGEHPDIAATADEYVFWRPPSHVSALGSYGLESFLKQHGIESMILSGFSSSGCLINTAKGAADKGWVVSVVEDACGDKEEAVHEIIMKRLLIGQVHVVGREELIGAWCKNACGTVEAARVGMDKLHVNA